MAESRKTEVMAERFDPDDSGDAVDTDISDWTNSQDSDSHKKRTHIVCAIIKNCTTTDSQSKDHLKTILESGWNVNEILDIFDVVTNKWVHRTALYVAARRGWTDGVKMLLDAGAKYTMSDALETPLVLALREVCCPLDLLKLLLEHGEDPNDHDDQPGNTPLLLAVMCHYAYGKDGKHIVKLLLEHGADPNVTHRVDIGRLGRAEWVNRTALHEAVSQGWTEGLELLLGAGAKCTTSDALENPLLLALKRCDCSVEIIEMLLRHGADPNGYMHADQREKIPLLNAIENYHPNSIRIAKLLLRHGADPNVLHIVDTRLFGERKWGKRSALHEAIILEWTEMVKTLYDAGARFVMSKNPLVLALQNQGCPADLIELLLKYIADSDYHKTDMDMPLVQAITNYWIEDLQCPELSRIVRLLLEHGANPDAPQRVNKQKRGKWLQMTALQAAVSRGWTEGVRILLEWGAKCVTSDISENPLALALQNNRCSPELIEMLLRDGVDVNNTVVADKPLLHRLSQYTFHGQHMFLQRHLDFFFQNGGNINVEDSEHRTALEHAVREGSHINSLRWLIRHGADVILRFSLIRNWLPETHFILIQSGLRVSYGTQTQLRKMVVAIAGYLQDDTMDGTAIQKALQGMWGEVAQIEEGSRRKQYNQHEYLARQMIDMQEFSDESLHIYPEDTHISPSNYSRQGYHNILFKIYGILEFVSQPQSLQWYCLRCIRENLVSLQPSVVKTLPGPAKLKRYILCHGI